MESFDSIFQRAAERKGGTAALEELLPEAASARSLKRRKDDRYLSEMTACVFRAGFVWQIIERKWPGFEEAFDAFDVSTCAMLSDERLEQLMRDDRVVKNRSKLASVRRNAGFILEVRESHGSFGAYLADWPGADITGLWAELKRRGDRLGGQTGRYFLRFVGKDTPVLAQDVVTALKLQRVIDREPTSKRALAQVQAAFNQWREESGRDLCQISRVLAASV
ncbi:MAG: DNA-3-methyladenine glycosylase I [Pseudomonadales bacterium]